MKKKLKRIKNEHINDYLQERDCFPEYEDWNGSYYQPTAQLFDLLDNYYVEFILIPNKK